jgi:methionine-rich copper-binding protein CopC
MFMNLIPELMDTSHLARILILVVSLMPVARTHAQPVIVSTDPASGATGIRTSASLVITFSEAMNTSATVLYLFAFDGTNYQSEPSSSSWTTGNTVLTGTPMAAFPTSQLILWTVSNGQNPAGTPLGGYIGGTFTTASSNGGLTLTNATWSAGVFSFDVLSQPTTNLTVEYSSTLRSNQWQTFLTTNSQSGNVHISDPQSRTNAQLFYRARNGS